MRISDSRPTYRTRRMAECAAQRVEDYFGVKCRVLELPPGWRVLPPQTLGATRADAIENFLVAYGRGWEDRKALPEGTGAPTPSATKVDPS